jgi:uncharacterized membrane-anchored protein YhcB (DUF1043 family)
MEYLYQELPRQTRASLSQHLAVCTTCREQVNSWRGVGQVLSEWRVTTKRSPHWAIQPWLKWGIAALLVLGMGFLIGRFTLPALANTKALQAELRQQLRAELQSDWQAALQKASQDLAAQTRRQNQAEMARISAALVETTGEQTQHVLTEFVNAYETERQKEYQTLLTTLRRLESQRVEDNTVLRTDLETVALTTAAEIQQAHTQIGRLAAYTQPSSGKNNNP